MTELELEKLPGTNASVAAYDRQDDRIWLPFVRSERCRDSADGRHFVIRDALGIGRCWRCSDYVPPAYFDRQGGQP